MDIYAPATQYTVEDGLIYKEPKSSRSKRTIDVSNFVLEVLKKIKVEQSLLLKNGESLKLICDRLGHSSIGITSHI
ncbi:MAG: hypothetical protein H0Z40_12105 [Desulfotomaculum sp.]|nr:hypothetical protein [Desulfotomaculum sp.]